MGGIRWYIFWMLKGAILGLVKGRLIKTILTIDCRKQHEYNCCNVEDPCHSLCHNYVIQPASPRLHHSFVDKIWWTWQTCHGINNFQPTFLDVTRNTQYSASDVCYRGLAYVLCAPVNKLSLLSFK
jgi:hypothetical protein